MGPEKFIKENIGEKIIGTKPPLKNCNRCVRLDRIQKKSLKRAASYGGKRLFIHGERIKHMLQTESTEDLGYKLENVWGYQRSRYNEFYEKEDGEKLSYLCKKLAKVQKSKAAFKHSMIDFINLLFFNVVLDSAPFGGLIGTGECCMDSCLSYFELFRRYAVFQDAFGFMKSIFDVGPGCMLVGQSSGLTNVLALSEVVPQNNVRAVCI